MKTASWCRARSASILALTALTGALVATTISATPAAAAVALPDLVVTGSFDEPTYTLSDAATATFSVKNVGAATAYNVQVAGADSSGLGGAVFENDGFDLAVGQTKTVTVWGIIGADGRRHGVVSMAMGFSALLAPAVVLDDEEGGGGDVADEPTDANPEDNNAVAKAKVLGATGTLIGTVFHESDGDDSTVDPEGVPGVKIALYDDFAPTVKVTEITTDAAGKFSITKLPAGAYTFKTTLPPGWEFGGGYVTNGSQVVEGANDPVLISLVNPSLPARPALPATGTKAGLIGAAGLGVLVAGVLLVLFTRRRKASIASA